MNLAKIYKSNAIFVISNANYQLCGMDILEFRDFCLSLPEVSESTPFDEDYLVYKVAGKMFALASMVDFERIALKCDPDLAIELRERYNGIEPAWHFNKRHWNDVYVNRDLSDTFIREQIFNSCRLVVEKNVTPRAAREGLLALLASFPLK